MKIAVVAAIVCASARAYAGPPTFDTVKLVSQRPAVHKAAEVHKAIKPLHGSLAACGTPRIDPRLSATLTANVELKIGGDGAVGDVTLDSKTLGEDTVDCIATAVRTVKLPAKKKPSVVRLVLVYKRK